eukprot:SAG22_NODE_106_length_19904_cov_14.387175_11_plen_64_part_00
MGGAEVLQAAAAEWADKDVADAMAELLRRAVPLVTGPADELATWLGSMLTALAGALRSDGRTF